MIRIKPFVPFGLNPLGSQAIDAVESNTFIWTFKDIDPADTQLAYYIEYKENILGSVLNTTNWITSSTSQHIFIANTFINNKSIAWRVKVKCSSNVESDFSDWVLFRTSAKPTCAIVSPSDDTYVAKQDIITIQHSFTDTEGLPQKSYQYKIYADDGSTLLWTSDLFTDYNNLTVCPKGLLQNNTYYKIEVTVTDSDNLSNTSTKRRFYTNFEPYSTNGSDFMILPDNENSRMNLKWVNIKSKPFTYIGSGARYLPAVFGNGIEIKELGEKLYIDINCPEIFSCCNIFIPNTTSSGTLEYFYKDASNWMRFFYDETGQQFIMEKCINGEIRTTGSPLTVLSSGQVAWYHIQQTLNGNVIIHSGIRGSGILSKWGDI